MSSQTTCEYRFFKEGIYIGQADEHRVQHRYWIGQEVYNIHTLKKYTEDVCTILSIDAINTSCSLNSLTSF